jgi:hypothetical protein
VKYPDGQEVKMGDKVRLGQDRGGVVVCSIDAGEYSSAFPHGEWAHLKRGVLINFPTFGLIHYEEPEADLELIERASD